MALSILNTNRCFGCGVKASKYCEITLLDISIPITATEDMDGEIGFCNVCFSRLIDINQDKKDELAP